MNTGVKIRGSYKGLDPSIMIHGKIFRNGHITDHTVPHDLFVKLKEESNKGGWFNLVYDNEVEYLRSRGITHFRDVEIRVGKAVEETLKEDIVEEVVEEVVAEETKEEEKVQEVVEEEKPKKATKGKKTAKEDEVK